jgi:enediyne biosynthesis protein E4
LPDGRLMVQQVDAGNGHSGKRSPELHFGLGPLSPSTKVAVDLSWRDVNGAIHRQTLHLTPGLHTILLASQRRRNS